MCNSFNFSPSLNHTAIMNDIKSSMRYSGSDFAKWQNLLKTKLIELMGDLPSEKIPLNVRSLWKKKTEYGTIEKIVYQTEVACDVPAYMCLPNDIAPPYDCFICLQGHSTGMHNSIGLDFDDEMRTITVEGDRDFAIDCMKRGIAALCIEQRSMGFRLENHQNKNPTWMCDIAGAQALLLGRTLQGERVYDVDCGIDYLQQRGDINMNTLGIMGNSGGGTTSLYAAAILDRIKIAMPSCYLCTFNASLMSMYHCICNYIPGLLKYAEMADVLGLFAPKPVIVVSGEKDEIFPIEGAKDSFAHLKKIYAGAGDANRCHFVIGNDGHRFYAKEAWTVALKELENIKATMNIS